MFRYPFPFTHPPWVDSGKSLAQLSLPRGGPGSRLSNDSVIRYGSFITALVNFAIIAFALFLVIKALNAAQDLANRNKLEEEPVATELDLLTEIRDELRNRN
jgi:large conductance mechanosensitive channel protein